MGAAIAIAVVLLIVGVAGGYFLGAYYNKSSSSGTSSSTTQITETGSSLLYPLMKIWGPNYTAYNPAVVLSPASTGSGAGQTGAELGTVNLGASDGYLSNASATSLLNVPVAISAQLIYYNLPGVTGHLNLNGTVLARIYAGNITTWDDPAILAAQSSAVQTELKGLSSEAITTIIRADSSGDTFLFTSLCYMSWSKWPFGAPKTSGLSGDKITGVTPETGNSGMVTGVTKITGSIAYIGISYEGQVAAAGVAAVNYAALGDNSSLSASGGVNPSNYILPSPGNISEDANLGLTHLQFNVYQLSVSMILGGSPAGAINLTLGGGGTAPPAGETPYPIVNLEYTLIKTAPTGTIVTSAALSATVHFLQWAISYGNFAPSGAVSAYLAAVSFIPLTPAVIGYDNQELASVQT
jgi:phosphate transport system substrate-binding protein